MKKKDIGIRIKTSYKFDRRDARVRTSSRLLEMWRRDLWKNVMVVKKKKRSC